ncbi:MAG TPA: hypothetical protein PKH77_28015, partial [Anaerolineae bacterium]|nr:hypothetical protein [Anaerolineae bacterium]
TNAQAVAAVEAAGTLDITVTHAIEADNAGGANYSHVVVVAKSGGDYTTIQAAIEAITDETAINPYLVWIAPGTYNEVVTMKPYVHLQGAGQEATIVTSNESGAASPGATIELASYASLRDLTVVNEGTGTANSSAAIRVSSGVNTFVSDVTVRAQGTTTKTYGIYSSVSATDVSMTLQDVTIIVDNDHGSNYGLANYGGEVTVEGGSVTVSGGNSTGPTGGSFSIFNSNTLAKLVTKNVIMSCENAWSCFTLSNENGAIATLYGGSITAVNGVHTRGIRNWGNAKTALVAENVSVHATGGTEDNYGFVNRGARVSWYGGSIIVDGVSPNSRGINASDITGEMTVWQSVVKAADHAIYVYEGNVTLFHSHLEGGGTGGSGTPVCVAVSRDTAFTGAGPTCP